MTKNIYIDMRATVSIWIFSDFKLLWTLLGCLLYTATHHFMSSLVCINSTLVCSGLCVRIVWRFEEQCKVGPVGRYHNLLLLVLLLLLLLLGHFTGPWSDSSKKNMIRRYYCNLLLRPVLLQLVLNFSISVRMRRTLGLSEVYHVMDLTHVSLAFSSFRWICPEGGKRQWQSRYGTLVPQKCQSKRTLITASVCN